MKNCSMKGDLAMRDVNKLDAKGLRNLGIDFNTEDEMDRFATLIRDEMEMRV